MMDELQTPEEVSASLNGKIPAHMIRRLVRYKKVGCTRGNHRAVLFTPEQRDALLAYLAEPAETTAPGTFNATSRSKASRRGK